MRAPGKLHLRDALIVPAPSCDPACPGVTSTDSVSSLSMPVRFLYAIRPGPILARESLRVVTCAAPTREKASGLDVPLGSRAVPSRFTALDLAQD